MFSGWCLGFRQVVNGILGSRVMAVCSEFRSACSLDQHVLSLDAKYTIDFMRRCDNHPYVVSLDQM